MSIGLRRATASELAAQLPELDQQFVFGKGRKLSLLQRYPAMFAADGYGGMYVLASADSLLSSLCCKTVLWHERGRVWRGAMIGAVYTPPALRQQQYASTLLQAFSAQLTDDGYDFAVLWASQSGFYARQGWAPRDSSVVAELPARQAPAEPTVTVRAMDASLAGEMEAIRTAYLPSRIMRNPIDYLTLPLPAADLHIHRWLAGGGDCYALLGWAGDQGYVYEMVGNPKGYAALWRSLLASGKHLLINDALETPSYLWLSDQAGVSWQAKSLAMWQSLSVAFGERGEFDAHISFLDRV
ncbi:GNAT family N-acetyltransferase [Chitinimonas sp.]|uniref:GNAT family N-acetyltransferase n=1 Tax=Chitinimonas sp. TaxID=1934313 RepID=UPI0035AF3A97